MYKGTLNQYKMGDLPLRAYTAYNNQRRRCYSISNKDYKNYGLKGIRVEYGPREFISWYIKSYQKFIKKNPGIIPHCGRKDHSKNYFIGNIMLQTPYENTKEVLNRLGNPVPRKPVYIYKKSNNFYRYRAESLKHAEKITGVDASYIGRRIKKISFNYGCDDYIFLPAKISKEAYNECR